MPTYQYACTECGHGFETVQSFSDDALTECPQCTGRLRKVFNSVGIVFKGSGFYRTDSREKPKDGADKASTEKAGTEKAGKDGAGKGTGDTKKADTASTASTSSGSSGSPSSGSSSASTGSSGSSTSSGSSSSGSAA